MNVHAVNDGTTDKGTAVVSDISAQQHLLINALLILFSMLALIKVVRDEQVIFPEKNFSERVSVYISQFFNNELGCEEESGAVHCMTEEEAEVGAVPVTLAASGLVPGDLRVLIAGRDE